MAEDVCAFLPGGSPVEMLCASTEEAVMKMHLAVAAGSGLAGVWTDRCSVTVSL